MKLVDDNISRILLIIDAILLLLVILDILVSIVGYIVFRVPMEFQYTWTLLQLFFSMLVISGLIYLIAPKKN